MVTEESRLLEWYVMLENHSFMDQLHQSISTFNFSCNSKFFKILLTSYYHLFSFDSLHILFTFQGFSDLSLTSGEAAAILLKVECQLGWEISHEEIDQGHLASLLILINKHIRLQAVFS